MTFSIFCTSCRSKVKEGHKVCRNCGAKVGIGNAGPADSDVVQMMSLAPLTLALEEIPIEILKVSLAGPNDESCFVVTVHYLLENESGEDWNYVHVRAQLLNAYGQPVDEAENITEELITSGKLHGGEISFRQVNGSLLGAGPEKLHVILNVLASKQSSFTFDDMDIPALPFDVASFEPTLVKPATYLISGSLWKAATDDGEESRVEIRTLIQNISDKQIPLVKFLAHVTDKQGKDLLDIEGAEELRPGQVLLISGGECVKGKRLIGAKFCVALHAYWPVAIGITQQQGAEMHGVGGVEQDQGEISCALTKQKLLSSWKW